MWAMTDLYADYHRPVIINTSPLEATCAALCRLICTMDTLINGGREALRMSMQLAHAVQQLIQAEEHNWRVKTKAEMLMNAQWRARVLRDLGGEKALARWERLSGHWRKTKDILKPHASPAQRLARAANLEIAKAANRDKLFKSGPKHKAGDDYHPHIVFDRVKVDMEGQFRLAPIMRQKIKIKAQAAPNPQTLKTRLRPITYTKINPIPLWPIEFRVAEGIAAEAAYETKSAPPNPVIPHKTRSVADAGPADVPQEQSTNKPRKRPQALNTDSALAGPQLIPRQARDDYGARRREAMNSKQSAKRRRSRVKPGNRPGNRQRG